MNAMVQHHDAEPQGNRHNPFASAPIAARPTSNAIADAGQQREIAEVQGAMVIAKRFPRNPIEAMDKILQACTRPTLAEGALYSYGRGGSEVTGPSIRLAEVAAQSWGNVQFGIRELEQRNGESTVEAFAWDVETNTRQVKVFQVRHIRHTKKGAYKLEDPRDVYELVANQGARRLRACILGVIPGDVIEAAVRQCEETLRANADTSPEALKKIVDAFAPFGVTQGQIEKRIQSRLEAIRPAQVVQLKKIYSSLRDGMSSPGDWFEADATGAQEAANEAPAATLRDRVRKAKNPQPAQAEAEAPKAASFEDVQFAIRNAASLDELDAAFALVENLPEGDAAELTEEYRARRVSLTTD